MSTPRKSIQVPALLMLITLESSHLPSSRLLCCELFAVLAVQALGCGP